MLDLAVTNSQKSVLIVHRNFFFPEFPSLKLGVHVRHECILHTNNYGMYLLNPSP